MVSEVVDGQVDVLVIGAGPAGLAAAVAAARAGARVDLLDAHPRAGGQFWRHGRAGPGPLHHDLRRWQALAGQVHAEVAAGRLVHHAGLHVWRVDPADPSRGQPFAVVRARGTESAEGTEPALTRTAGAVVLATGAQDRVLPFPGWTLPGVLTPGAVQALLKEHGVLAGQRIVVAGTGPFLLPVAAGLARAGAGEGRRVVAVLEAGGWRGWLRGWRALAGRPEVLAEASRYAAVLARHAVPLRRRQAIVAAHGADRVEAVTVARLDQRWRVVPGSLRRIECDTVAVGFGFTPRLELALQTGCDTVPGPDGNPVVLADRDGRTSVPGILVAGELTGVGGAPLALVSGTLAGRAAAGAVGLPELPPERALLRRRDRLVRFAAALHAAYPIGSGWTGWLEPDTVICRCEEVPLARLHEAIRDLQATDARAVRLLTRCGMGWCQGRICADAVTAILDRAVPQHPSPVSRPIAAPVTLRQLAALDTQQP